MAKTTRTATHATANEQAEVVTISPPNFKEAVFTIVGTAPYVQNKFSKKVRDQIHETQASGSTARKGKKREPKDFQRCYEEAIHRAGAEGWIGIPASGLRRALISACRIVNFHMTRGKLALFVLADDFDTDDGSPLVRIVGEPQYSELGVRNESGVVDLRARPMWKPGWRATVRIRFDADMFTVTDVANLLMRAGQQVGIGEGRPDSPNSCGMGWGTFEIADRKEAGRD